MSARVVSRRTCVELQALFGPRKPDQVVEAVPGTGLEVPLWILGSSLYGAQLAAALGLPYAFASHFAPDELDAALATYRAQFRPSAQLAAPYAMVGVERRRRGRPTRKRGGCSRRCSKASRICCAARAAGFSRRSTTSKTYWTPAEKAQASRMLACSFVGSPATVRAQLAEFVARDARRRAHRRRGHLRSVPRGLRSYELLAEPR